ncbi:MAG: ParB/RepB/Spo0J family partition protein [Acutalibacteraceae bacterium]|nr:ParB/RepB/Spo0J family partition protein [Clostridia bacterium]MEE3404587.1 ParB/RepB/Spo0J family partition protein [Acutalibacteraceae bacterium]
MAIKKGGLGKGLDAIFMENDTEDSDSTVTLKLSEIEPNRSQPRRDFNEESLRELADSIAMHGVLQPLLVRPLPEGGYQLVAGERRWRASRMAGLFEVPVIIREMSDAEMMEISLVENLQRENLNPVEEALGYKMLQDEYQLTQEEIAKYVGKSRPVVANALRLLSLSEPILTMLREGRITTGHARALLAINDPEEQLRIAELIEKNDLTVRDIERAAKSINAPDAKEDQPVTVHQRNSFFDEVELALHEHLSRKVKVINGKDNGGVLQIEFYSEEDLSDLAKLFERD